MDFDADFSLTHFSSPKIMLYFIALKKICEYTHHLKKKKKKATNKKCVWRQ